MNKTELLALALSLGLSADESMTKEQLLDLIAKRPVVTPATPITANAVSGKSSVKTFRYSKNGYCIATLGNGVKGIVGNTESCSLRDMLALKGSGIQVLYTEEKKGWTDVDGVAHKNYRLEWSLE